MDVQEMIHLLQEEMELLEAALEAAHEAIGKKLGELVVHELRPVDAYCSSLRSRIRQLEHGMPIHDREQKEALIEQWRTLYEQYPIPEDQNTRRQWPW